MKKLFLILLVLALCTSNSYTQNLSEGFEGTTFPPEGWTRINLGDAQTWYRSTSGYRTGVACARIDYSAAAHNDWLITPKLAPATGNSSISFWAKNYSTTYVERFNVLLSTTGTNTTDFTVTLASNIGPGTTYTQYTYDLSAYIGSNVYVAIQSISTDQYYLYIDDFEGPPLFVPACSPPTALNASNITTTGATLGWTAPGTPPTNGYEWEVRTTGAGGDPAPDFNGTTAAGVTTDNASGLSSGTNYNLYVRSNCGGDFSSWAGPFGFQTIATAATPYIEGFATTTAPSGWTTTGWLIGSTRGVTGNPGNNIYKNIYSVSTSGASFTSTNIGPILAGEFLSFDYIIANYSSPYAPPVAGSGNYVVEISTDYGATYSTLETFINDGIAGYRNKSYDLSAYVGQYVKVKITGNWVSGDYDLAFDNFKVEVPPTATLSWFNLQWPPDATIAMNEQTTVYARCWEDGVTNLPGPGDGIEAWIGYSTENTNPDTWTNWVPAVFNVDAGNDDEYMADLGMPQGLAPGTYYYASRFRYQNGPYTYGGFGGPWDGTGNVSGVLTVTACNPTGFPYSENFDGTWGGTPAAPLCWTVINADNDAYTWSQGNTYIAPTPSLPYAAHGMGNQDDWLISPAIDLTGSPARVMWKDKVESVNYPNNYKVYISTTTPEIGSFTTELGDYNCTNTAWTEHIINLDAYQGQTVYIAFWQYFSQATFYGFGIDDFSIDLMPPPCPVPPAQPTALLLNSTSTAVNGEFTASAATGYVVVRHTAATLGGTPANGTIYNAGDAIGNGTVVYRGTGTTFSSPGLDPSKTYYFFVFAYNSESTCTGPTYRTSAPLTGSIMTKPGAPEAFTATAVSSNAVSFNVTPNAQGHNIIVAWNTTNVFGEPMGAYNVGAQISGGGTVHYVGNASGLYNHTGLTPGATYYYRVWSVVAGPVYSSNFVNANATTYFEVPFLQDFNASTSLPGGWAGTGTVFQVLGNHGTNGSNGLTRNLYGTGDYQTANITSPVVLLPNNGCRLMFDYRIVNYTGYPSTATPNAPGNTIEFQISTNGIDFETLYMIDETNHIVSNQFAKVVIPLSEYTGPIQIKIIGNRATGDFYVDIDNFTIDIQPLLEFTPESFDFGEVFGGTQSDPQEFIFKNFRDTPITVSNVGISGPDSDHFVVDDNNSYPLTLLPNASASVDVLFSANSIGQKNANLQLVDNFGEWTASLTGLGYVDPPKNLTATAVPTTSVQLNWLSPTYQPEIEEGFEGITFPPSGWLKLNPDGGTGWTTLNAGVTPIPGWEGGVATSAPEGGNKMAFATWTTGGATENDQWLISPQITVGNNNQLSFYLRYFFINFDDNFEIRISTQSQNNIDHFTILVDEINFTSTSSTSWQLYSYNLSDFVPVGTQIYIAFREMVSDNLEDGSALMLDNVYVGQPRRNMTEITYENPSIAKKVIGYKDKNTSTTTNETIQFTEISNKTVNLRNADPVNYTVYRGTSSGVYDTEFETIETQFLDETTSSGTTYYYSVAANYPQGQSLTDEVVINTLCTDPQTTPYFQQFNGTSIPVCWTNISLNSSNQVWEFGTISRFGASNPALTGNYAYLDSDAYGSGSLQNADLRSPLFDFSNNSSISLSFKHYFRSYTGSSATLSYSIDGGETWNIIQTWTATTANPATFNQSIPEVAGESNVMFKWNYTGSWGFYWAIDDVVVNEGMSVAALPENLSCFESNDGSISLEILGGLSPYTILWTGPDGFTSDQQYLTGLAAGQYLYSVTDDSGIVASDFVTLTQPDEVPAPQIGDTEFVYDGTVQTVEAIAPAGTELVWFDAPEGGEVIEAPMASDAGVYPAWVAAFDALVGCESARIDATMTIDQRDLTVTADDQSKCQNTENPELSLTYEGFAAGEDVENLETAPEASTTATLNSLPGEYPITVSGGISNNYAFNYENGTLTVIASPIVDAGDDGSVCVNEAFPIVDASASNFTTVLWSSSGNGSFSDVNAVNPIYTPGSADIANGFVTLTLTGDPASPCSMSDDMVLTIQNDLPVSVTISLNTPEICNGTLVSFSAMPVNGGLDPSYQWKVNGTNAGTDSPNFEYVPADGDVVTVVLTSSIGCALNNPATSNAITVNVTPDLTAEVSIDADATEVCDFTPVTFTAYPVNGGMSPSYQWLVNGEAAGTNSATFTYAPLDGDAVSVVMTSSHLCAVVPVATSNVITMSVAPPLLVLIPSPANGGTVSGGGNYADGAVVTVTATPSSGWEFLNWRNMAGEIVSTDATFDYTINLCYDELVATFSSTARIAGQLKYFNALETTIPSAGNNIQFYVQLFENGEPHSDRQLVKYNPATGLDSYFEFIGAESGKDYTLKIYEQPTSNLLGNTWAWNNWGGASSVDALIISYMSVGNPVVSSYPWILPEGASDYTALFSKVADITGDGNILGSDPLALMFRTIGLPGYNPFPGGTHNFQLATTKLAAHADKAHPAAPEVLFAQNGTYTAASPASSVYYEAELTNLNDGLNVFNVYFVATGDMNTSYVPGAAAKAGVNLDFDNIIAANVGDEILIPVVINQAAELGAISLGLSYNTDLIQVVDVIGYEISNIDPIAGTVNIAWMDQLGKAYGSGQEILVLKAKVLADIEAGTAYMSLLINTEFGDRQANVLHDISLSTSYIETGVTGIGDLSDLKLNHRIFPNPFNDATQIQYTLPVAGKVRVDVYNHLGQLVITLADELQQAGAHKLLLNNYDLNGAGSYFYQIVVDADGQRFTERGTIVLTK